MSEEHQSKAVEDFLKAVYALQQGDERVTTNDLREALAISAPSVTDMAQRLENAGLVDYQKYRGVALTESGRDVALRVIRRHRLIELFLVNELGYALQDVHDEAERLEHVVSDQFVEAIARKLGDPFFDPHGDPIPAADLSIQQPTLRSLSDLPLHLPAVVSRFKTSDPVMLEHILERGFKLRAEVIVLDRDPFEGPVTTTVDGKERVIGHNVALCIFVEPADSDAQAD